MKFKDAIKLFLVAGALLVESPAHTAGVVTQSEDIRSCNLFSGSDAAARLAACIADLPNTGGTADARGMGMTSIFASDPFIGITKPVSLLIGHSTYVGLVDVTINSNVTLIFGDGGKIFMNPGRTLTVNGGIDAPLTHIFTGEGSFNLAAARITAVYPQWWGASVNDDADDSRAIQSAIDAAGSHPVHALAGRYVVERPLKFRTSIDSPGLRLIGAGIRKTVFDNRVLNGAMLTVDGEREFQFQFGAYVADFSITSKTSPPGSDGIVFRSQWGMRISSVGISGLSGDAIRGLSTGDANSSAYFEVSNCFIEDNGGWGIDLEDTALTIVLGEFSRNHVARNSLGGIRASGQSLRFTNNSFSDNGSVGLHIRDGDGASPRNVAIWDNEFQSNVLAHIKIDYGVGIEGGRNHYNSDNLNLDMAFRPPIAVDIGSATGIVQQVMFSRDVIRVINRGANPHIVYRLGRNAHYVTIENPVETSMEGANLWMDQGTASRFVRNNRDIGSAVAASMTSVSTTPSRVTPDLLEGPYHTITATPGASVITVNAPGGFVPGRELILEIHNVSEDVLTLAFDAKYQVNRFVAPPSGSRTTARFICNSSNQWVQVGSWSLLEAAITVPQITANQKDYLPKGGLQSTVWRVSTDATRTLTGIVAGEPGQRLSIINVGGHELVLANLNTESMRDNRIVTGNGRNLSLASDESVALMYDTTSTVWRIIK